MKQGTWRALAWSFFGAGFAFVMTGTAIKHGDEPHDVAIAWGVILAIVGICFAIATMNVSTEEGGE